VLAALLAAALPAGGRAADRPKSCDEGRPLFASGRLRIVAVTYRTESEWGSDQYACLGRRGAPLFVGYTYDDFGVATNDTPAYVYDGGRHLAALWTSDSEGGPSANYWVFDLRAGRHVGFENIPYPRRLPAFGLAGGGELVHRRQVGVRGRTVYWTARGGEARRRRVAGPPVRDNAVLAPVRPQLHEDPCTRAAGRTVAQSPSIRVLTRGGRRFTCRHGDPALRPIERRARVRIAWDRWLLVVTRRRATVRDTRTGVRIHAPRPRFANVLRDGTLVWTTASGALRARPFGAGTDTLASHAAGAAVSARTVYWRAGGAPHSWRR
jgi:hypothetical protein